MDQEKQIEEISEIEEIKHMLIEMMKTQDVIIEKLERLARHADRRKSPLSTGKKQ